jgi:SAM-dependent methyltransferase
MLSPQDWHARFTHQARWTAPLRTYLYERIDIKSARRILEVGCGTGAILAELLDEVDKQSRARVHGLDLEATFLSLAVQHAPHARLTQGDAQRMPYASASFDLVACHFTLLWVDEPGQVLVEMKRLVRPGGVVIVLAEPDYGGRIDYPDELSQLGAWQEQALSRQGAHTRLGRRLGDLLQDAGLQEVETGLLGGQWRGSPSPQAWQSEWQVMHADLDGYVDPEILARLEDTDRQASRRGTRVLFVPTFYAWGRAGFSVNVR